jgi:hypothetical protein
MTDPHYAPNMAYAPHSPPAFPGDLQHDLRDHLYARRLDTLAEWVGEASHLYLRAAGILRRRMTDPLAVALDMDHRFDARTLWVAHDHMAAHWRATCLPEILRSRGKMLWGPRRLANPLNSYGCLTAIFRDWLRLQTGHWADHCPDVLELFLLAMVGEHTRTGKSVEAELCFTLAWQYPLPGVQTPMPRAPMRAR